MASCRRHRLSSAGRRAGAVGLRMVQLRWHASTPACPWRKSACMRSQSWADAPSRGRTVGVPHFTGEAAGGRRVGVVLGEGQPRIEEAALTGGGKRAWGRAARVGRVPPFQRDSAHSACPRATQRDGGGPNAKADCRVPPAQQLLAALAAHLIAGSASSSALQAAARIQSCSCWLQRVRRCAPAAQQHAQRASGTHYSVSGGPMMVTCHSNRLLSSTRPAEKPSTGFFIRSVAHACTVGSAAAA